MTDRKFNVFAKILNGEKQKEKGRANFALPQNLRLLEMPLFSPDPPILNKGETGQQKRCTIIREAYLMPPQNSFVNYDRRMPQAITWSVEKC